MYIYINIIATTLLYQYQLLPPSSPFPAAVPIAFTNLSAAVLYLVRRVALAHAAHQQGLLLGGCPIQGSNDREDLPLSWRNGANNVVTQNRTEAIGKPWEKP